MKMLMALEGGTSTRRSSDGALRSGSVLTSGFDSARKQRAPNNTVGLWPMASKVRGAIWQRSEGWQQVELVPTSFCLLPPSSQQEMREKFSEMDLWGSSTSTTVGEKRWRAGGSTGHPAPVRALLEAPLPPSPPPSPSPTPWPHRWTARACSLCCHALPVWAAHPPAL